MKHRPVPTDDLRERFILFLAGKPADQAYDWSNRNHCACGTFINECLTKKPVRNWWWPSGVTVARVDPAEAEQVWCRWNNTACSYPRTYGALLQRVRAE